MFIFTIRPKDYVQTLTSDPEYKHLYGEIFTPFSIVDTMLDMMDSSVFSNPSHTFMDGGAGTGYFTMALCWKLDTHLTPCMPDETQRRRHILSHMVYMCEIRPENVLQLKKCFGTLANIIEGDFLSYKERTFHYVIGNPPYNCNGIKKVPTNTTQTKSQDGVTIWYNFVRHSIELLKDQGELLVIIPSLWMRPDKEHMYTYMTRHKLCKIKCLSNTETNKAFKGEAQTPTSMVHVRKTVNDYIVDLYDSSIQCYVPYTYQPMEPIPVFGASILRKIRHFQPFKTLCVYKTNMPSRKASLSNVQDTTHPFENVRTAVIADQRHVRFIKEYSSIPLAYHGVKKLILAHKMYGFPYLDLEGNYGISNRDTYVIVSEDELYLKQICDFFKTKFALYLLECTRYRMKYIEKHIFELIPDVTYLNDFPDTIHDTSLSQYFRLSDEEIHAIHTLHTKSYSFQYVE
jgi:DNA-binding cell septation regulator SpoVG